MGQRASTGVLEDVSELWWDLPCCTVPHGVPSFEGEECSRMGELGAEKRARPLGSIVPT